MKYVKIFEEFGEKLYRMMTSVEIDEIFGDVYSDKNNPNFIEFTKREVENFRKIRWFGESMSKKSLSVIPHHEVIDHITIYSLGDEFYVIQEESEFLSNRSAGYSFYKCDTIEGVKQYLNDKKLINNQ